MRSPAKVIESGWCARRLTQDILGNGAQRRVNACIIEVALELAEFPLEVRTPQKNA